ncbi:MAG TPA: sigma factor-like helix-turn-helix DNA-binding protein [Geodermatophilus sp.]|nr:sigma factor-like helix-turn-helix DNA-binding protein [Geodermatophilus sp.]
MGGDRDAAFRRLVADERPALLRAALLLTGSRTEAEDLVQAALARTHRRWSRVARDGEPADHLRTVLVGLLTGRRARLLRTEQVLESADEPDPYLPDEGDATARVLHGLPPDARAVVVLLFYEERSEAGTARLLGRPVETVRAHGSQGLARLRAALPDGGPPADGDEQRVRDRLTALAGAPARWRMGTDDAVADVLDRHRRYRRRLAGAVAAACAVGAAVLLALTAPEPPPARPADVAVGGPPDGIRRTPVLVEPTRGSLTGDRAFLDAVRRVGWGPQVPPPVDGREVVFGGDTPAGRVVLLVGTVDEDFRGVWLTGPVGAAPEALTPSVPQYLGRTRPALLVLGGPGPATLVVVAGRDDRIEVSDRLKVGPRGTVRRDYAPVEAVDGVAVVPARTTEDGAAVSVRVWREGRVVHRSGVDRPAGRGAGTVDLPPLEPLRPVTADPDPHLVAAALTQVAVPLGVEPEALEAQLLWSGRLPLTSGRGTVAVVVARSPGGGLVVPTVARAGPGGAGPAVACGTQTPPGTADVGGLTVARICDLSSSGGEGMWLVFTGPPAAARADVLDRRGTVLTTLELAGGGAVAPLPEGARTVRTHDAAGRPVGEAPIAPAPTEPFGDFGNGPVR